MNTRVKLTGLLLICCFAVSAQTGPFSYKRKLSPPTDEWHKIILPDALFEKVSPDFSDIRLLGFTEKGDTVEAPFILKISAERTVQKEVGFRLINKSKNSSGYYFTFELPEESIVNLINLDFGQENFDWKLDLEGSQDQKDWFMITAGYRILSIKNELTDFQFTTLNFPQSKYRYYRLFIAGNTKPELLAAKTSLSEVFKGDLRTYRYHGTFNSKIQQRQTRQTVYTINLPYPVPVGKLEIVPSDAFDFYRPVRVEYVSDSFKTAKGWNYTYETLTTGIVNSFGQNEYALNNVIAGKMRVVIENQDNEPLNIERVEVGGYEHSLLARFTVPADYYLFYGGKQDVPRYDISRFSADIPPVLTSLETGDEQVIKKVPVAVAAPLFENKLWLWAIMSVIIILLGFFSLKMIRTKSNSDGSPV